MVPIIRQIQQVVEHVHARRTQAEEQKRQQAIDHLLRLLNLMCRQQRDEDQCVLEPLMQAQRLAPVPEACCARIEHLIDIALRLRPPLYASVRIGNDGFSRCRPDAQIVRGIADVVEAALTVVIDQQVTLAMGRQVGLAIGRPHLIEQIEVPGNSCGQCFVSSGREDDQSSCVALYLNVLDDLRVVRQQSDVETGGQCEPTLEGGFAL